MRILLVCLGNICRSPTAEAALREALEAAGLDGAVEIDSAGTGGWHVGDPPDARMVDAAARVGLELSGAARRVRPEDFDAFDLILAMDRTNYEDLRALAPDAAAREKVRLFREFDPAGGEEVPDPYYGGRKGFEEVVAVVRRSAEGLVSQLQAHGLVPSE